MRQRETKRKKESKSVGVSMCMVCSGLRECMCECVYNVMVVYMFVKIVENLTKYVWI